MKNLIGTTIHQYQILVKIRETGTRILYKAYDARTHQHVGLEVLREVPAGVGKGGVTKLSRSVLKEILVRGAEWAVANGYGRAEDLERTEERGRMAEAPVDGISERALERGTPQLGTLGAGNHFLEIQKVLEIYDERTARTFGLHAPGQVLVMIHCGSRGLGHQVATDYIELLENAFGVAGLPDRELVNAPFKSSGGQRYYRSMSAAVNYAFANRQMIAHWVREVFARVLGSAKGMDQIYDVCHNVAKIEEHEDGGRSRRLVVHQREPSEACRKGKPVGRTNHPCQGLKPGCWRIPIRSGTSFRTPRRFAIMGDGLVRRRSWR